MNSCGPVRYGVCLSFIWHQAMVLCGETVSQRARGTVSAVGDTSHIRDWMLDKEPLEKLLTGLNTHGLGASALQNWLTF